MDFKVVLQSSIQDLDSAISSLPSDNMDVSDEKWAHPSNPNLPNALDVEQSDNGSSEHLGSAEVKVAIGNEDYPSIENSQQTANGKFIAVDACVNFSGHLAWNLVVCLVLLI